MLLYHGTHLNAAIDIKENGILLSRSKSFTDFGKGFYTSPVKQYAEDTALSKMRKSQKHNITLEPVIVIFEYDINVKTDLNILKFPEENVEWLQFIINNRNGIDYFENTQSGKHNLGSRFDIVSGRIADQNVVLLSEELKNNHSVVKEEDVFNVKYNKPYAEQISFHTPAALKTLRFLNYEYIINKEMEEITDERKQS